MTDKHSTIARPATAAIAVSILAGAILIIWPYSIPKNDGGQSETPSPIAYENAISIRSINALSYTRSRPLFSPDRKPGAINVVEVIDPAGDAVFEETANAEEFELKGTLEKDQQTLALLKWDGAPDGIWLSAGSDIGQWIIEEVHILLRSEDTVEKVSLFPDTDPDLEDLDISE